MLADGNGRGDHGNQGNGENVVGGKNCPQLFHHLVPYQVSEEVAENAEAKEVANDHRLLEGFPGNSVLGAEQVENHNGQRRQETVEENLSDGEKGGVLAAYRLCTVGVNGPGDGGAEGQHIANGGKLQNELSVKHHQHHSYKGDEGTCNLSGQKFFALENEDAY